MHAVVHVVATTWLEQLTIASWFRLHPMLYQWQADTVSDGQTFMEEATTELMTGSTFKAFVTCSS